MAVELHWRLADNKRLLAGVGPDRRPGRSRSAAVRCGRWPTRPCSPTCARTAPPMAGPASNGWRTSPPCSAAGTRPRSRVSIARRAARRGAARRLPCCFATGCSASRFGPCLRARWATTRWPKCSPRCRCAASRWRRHEGIRLLCAARSAPRPLAFRARRPAAATLGAARPLWTSTRPGVDRAAPIAGFPLPYPAPAFIGDALGRRLFSRST